MAKVRYNSELFDLIKDLTAITTQVVFVKDEDGKVFVKRADSESTIAYTLKAPSEFFDFTEDEIAFYNYPEFYQYFKALGEPELSISQKVVTLKVGSSKSSYLLSNPESIEPGPRSINFPGGDVKIRLTSENLDELLKMIGLINAKKAHVYGNGKKITIKVFNDLHSNTFEKSFKVENLTEFDGEIDFVMFASTFINLPARRDYNIEIVSDGFIGIQLEDENIELNIYTGRVKE